MTALSRFHPAVARWFSDTLGEPTTPQAQGWEAIRQGRHTLVAAPTGSGKTLAAFLNALDELLREGLERDLPAEVRVVYVSPLKALSADIHKNLAEPQRGIANCAADLGLAPVEITSAVRSGDTPASARTAMLATPPHILVTTPESLYLLLTAGRSREMLRTARTVVVDEIHAVIESRRGSHLALSLERLDHVCGRRLQRIGLSATQHPIDDVARFLVGTPATDPHGRSDCAIVDAGHRRDIDLAIEIPDSPLEAVMAGEVWEEIYDRLATLGREHRTTLVFVNTRRLAERVAHHLSGRLGAGAVMAHHGSLSKEVRLEAEDRLKAGRLQMLVATASLELGIDIGHVDLVCQLGSPHRIATFLQRAGRSGHTVRGTPKARLFAMTRDDLVECAALVRAVRRGELDRLRMIEAPRDVLAQQIVAEAACEDWDEDALYALVRKAYPYRALPREQFAEIVTMLARGYSTRRGRRAALVHYDAVNRRLRGRRGARLLAITSGGAIPDNADYRVVLEPQGTFIGTLNEDFAIESMAGDIFQLGNTSWRILRIESGVVRVEDAHGQPPSIPFWFGEAPARSDELSRAVSDLRHDVGERLHEPDAAAAWLEEQVGLVAAAATQIVTYCADTRRLLGVLPTQSTLVVERFFDESGGMQLVIHSPHGSRINRAWGLALRKRFCRQFNFELQAAATEDALLLSLGPQHSFPLADVFRYLHPDNLETILVQALLDAPMFQTRWRWNLTTSLAVPRQRGGRKNPPQIQRMEAEDLLAAVFPDAAACLENIAGDREIPDHPLVRQAVEDCLTDAMDLARLTGLIADIHAGHVECLARDLPEPSPFTHEILKARPYAFLDDAPLEERRAQAVYTRRALEPSSAQDLGALDGAAIERVREEVRPQVEHADELHDALLTSGYLTEDEGRQAAWTPFQDELERARRAARVTVTAADGSTTFWVAAERVPFFAAVFSDVAVQPSTVVAPAGTEDPSREDAIRELLRGRLEILGPVTPERLSAELGVPAGDVEVALAALEGQGAVLRGQFTPGSAAREWCERRLLARVHRYTLDRLRAEIEPVSTADFMRFLFGWQHLATDTRTRGLEGLAAVIEQLDGFELAAGAWEPDVLAARSDEYDPLTLDTLCLTGRVGWGRLAVRGPAGVGPAAPLRSTPVALFMRERQNLWTARSAPNGDASPSANAARVLEVLERRGASFFQDLMNEAGLLATQVEQALAELVAQGRVTSDSFAGLRALLVPASRRRPVDASRRRRGRKAAFGVESAGRWSILGRTGNPADRRTDELGDVDRIDGWARALLRRYGVVFRRLLTRETSPPPWRELLHAYRLMEARGEIRGGRFVAGVTGEQFALAEAVGQLRAVRKREHDGQLMAISAADPLNLTGIVTPGARIPGLAGNRVLFEDGQPVAAVEAREFRMLVERDGPAASAFQRAIARKRITPVLRAYLGQAG